MSQLNIIGRQFAENLTQAQKLRAKRVKRLESDQKINVVGAGGVITAAFEQLRKAAENTEEHLLLQSAIKRFFKSGFVTRDQSLIEKSGEELAIELTLAGYIPNDSLGRTQVEEITHLAVQYYTAYERLISSRDASGDLALRWTLDSLSSRVEAVLSDHSLDEAFVSTAVEYYTTLVNEREREAQDFGARLLAAIYRSLLKANDSLIRATLLARYGVTPDDYEQYASFNKLIDGLFAARQTDKLTRLVDRQGAPLRILRRMMLENEDTAKLLNKKEQFLEAFEQQIVQEYEHVGQRLNRAIIRSVIFLIITKFIIGIAIEVPYDYWAYGEIHWLPLIINLLFPPIYMVILRSTLSLPSYANTTALVDKAETMLYGSGDSVTSTLIQEKRYGKAFSSVYSISALLVFAAVVWVLLALGFSWVHIVIFFIFLSAASFLGFRLSRLVRELEVVREKQSGFTFVRDLVYLPFVIVGQWLNDKYSKVNVVTVLLDMLIELPLKTILRLVRQWNSFIDERKDNI